MTEYHKAIVEVLYRYKGWNINDPKLERFMDELYSGCTNGMPIMKANRWFGYIQGVLIERGFTTVEIERNLTRPLFQPLDFPEGQ